MIPYFIKYSGCGNDFIVLDNRDHSIPLSPLKVSKICHRQEGIGADGVVLLENSQTADFKMRIFNSDGSEAEMCGNGLRCLVQFLADFHLMEKSCTIETRFFQHSGEFVDQEILVSLRPPEHIGEVILKIDDIEHRLIFVNTGVPHGVLFVESLEKIDVQQLGKALRFHPRFAPQGLNVNFASILAKEILKLRTYERGVENETQACGTGATAAALAAHFLFGWESPVQVIPASQEKLTVYFEKNGEAFTHLKLQGPVRTVHIGELKDALEPKIKKVQIGC